MIAASGGKAACAGLLIEGEPKAVHVEAREVPLRQLLDAMQVKFNLHYRTDDNLDMRVTGTFNGSLRRVILRLLNDYDFVMKSTPEGIEVLVVRRNLSDIKVGVTVFPAKAPARSPALPVKAQEATNINGDCRASRRKPVALAGCDSRGNASLLIMSTPRSERLRLVDRISP